MARTNPKRGKRNSLLEWLRSYTTAKIPQFQQYSPNLYSANQLVNPYDVYQYQTPNPGAMRIVNQPYVYQGAYTTQPMIYQPQPVGYSASIPGGYIPQQARPTIDYLGRKFTTTDWRPSGWYQGPTPDMNWYSNLGKSYGLRWDYNTNNWLMPEKVIDENGNEAFINTRNRYGQPVGTMAPYGQTMRRMGFAHFGGPDVLIDPNDPSKGGKSYSRQEYRNPNRGAFNSARYARRAKRINPNKKEKGEGIQSASSGSLVNWSI